MSAAVITQLLKNVVDIQASDLHLVVGAPPTARTQGVMRALGSETLSPDSTQSLCMSLLDEEQKKRFLRDKEIDFSFGIRGSRFRANLFWQKGHVSGVFRNLPAKIPNWQDLHVPRHLAALTGAPNGLILVTGPTGSGKSTTMAALLDKINAEQSGHIITLEDPIEYVHQHKKCIVNQREIGHDSASFGAALRHLLRQDPDYVMVGELRDVASVDAALQIADTGHLVISSLHTNSAEQTITRLVDMFPGDQHSRIRSQLSMVLLGVVSQQLIPSLDGGRVAAFELLICNNAVRNLIREDKVFQIPSIMQMNQEKSGMRLMNQSLAGLVIKRRVDMHHAFEVSPHPEELDAILKQAGV